MTPVVFTDYHDIVGGDVVRTRGSAYGSREQLVGDGGVDDAADS